MEFLLPTEVLNQRCRLRLVNAQAVADGFFVVVGAVPQVAAALVAAIFQARWGGIDVVHLAAGFTGTAAGEALQQDIEVHIDQ